MASFSCVMTVWHLCCCASTLHRMAHLIYHGEHDHSSLDGEVDVALMLDTSKDGTKYLQLVLIPEELLTVMQAKERENEKVSSARQSKLLDKSLATQPYY